MSDDLLSNETENGPSKKENNFHVHRRLRSSIPPTGTGNVDKVKLKKQI